MTNNKIIRRTSSSMLKLASIVGLVILGGAHNVVRAEWDGGIEGGTAVNGDGGAASRLRFKLSNDEKPLSQYIYADWLRSSGGSSYEIGYKPRYWFGESLYVFGEAKAKQDKSLAIDIDRELFGLTGVGARYQDSDQRSLFAELGAGYRTTEFANDTEDSDTTGIARAGFRQVLSDIVSLELDADASFSEDTSTSIAEAGLAFKVPGGSLKYSHRTKRYKVGDLPSVSDSDSFVSFSYGF